MPDVAMPRLSDSMEEGTILKWLKSDGDEVAKGEELVEIETDKATMTYEADGDGTLSIVAQEGETLPIGEVIARLGEGGGDGAQAAGAGEEQEEEEAPEEDAAEEEPAEAASAEGDGSAPQAAPERGKRREAEPAPEAGGNGGRPQAPPRGRRSAPPR